MAERPSVTALDAPPGNQAANIDEAKIARLHKEGRGQGHGAEYRPWLTVQDVPSRGRSQRPLGVVTGRAHHLLSDLERKTFLAIEFRDDVRDIREQFPLDVEETCAIAEQAGIRRPMGRGELVHGCEAPRRSERF